jgi:WD40 repeat protein
LINTQSNFLFVFIETMVSFQLKQEIESHKGYVNSVCFDSDGQKMYSADSIGIINIWNVFVTEQPHHRGIDLIILCCTKCKYM